MLPPTPMATHVRTSSKMREKDRKSETPDFGDAADLFASETIGDGGAAGTLGEENIYENHGAMHMRAGIGFTTDYRLRRTPVQTAKQVTTHDMACSPLVFTPAQSPAVVAYSNVQEREAVESQTDDATVATYTASRMLGQTLKSPLNTRYRSSAPKDLGNFCATPDLQTPEGTPAQEKELKGIAKYGLTKTLRSRFSPSFGNGINSGFGVGNRAGSGKGRRFLAPGSSNGDSAPRAVPGWTPPASLPAPPDADARTLRQVGAEQSVHPMIALARQQGVSEVTPRRRASRGLLKSPGTPGSTKKKSVRWDPTVYENA